MAIKLVFFLTFNISHLQAGENSSTIELLHDAFSTGKPLVIQGEPIMATGILSLFYQSLNFEPAWSNLNYTNNIISLLGSSDKKGLFPRDYHYNALFLMTSWNRA